MSPKKQIAVLKVKPKEAIAKAGTMASVERTPKKEWNIGRKGRRAMLRARNHHVVVKHEFGLEDDLRNDPGPGGSGLAPTASSLAWLRRTGSCSRVLAAGTLYLQQVLTKIVRHWDWADHPRVAQKFAIGHSTPPRQALLMLQGGSVGLWTQSRLVHNMQLFATRALNESENTAGLAATYEAEHQTSELSGWQLLGRREIENTVCPQELVPAVVRGALRRLGLGEPYAVMWSVNESWEVFFVSNHVMLPTTSIAPGLMTAITSVPHTILTMTWHVARARASDAHCPSACEEHNMRHELHVQRAICIVVRD
jgi:hypothetical protein